MSRSLYSCVLAFILSCVSPIVIASDGAIPFPSAKKGVRVAVVNSYSYSIMMEVSSRGDLGMPVTFPLQVGEAWSVRLPFDMQGLDIRVVDPRDFKMQMVFIMRVNNKMLEIEHLYTGESFAYVDSSTAIYIKKSKG